MSPWLNVLGTDKLGYQCMVVGFSTLIDRVSSVRTENCCWFYEYADATRRLGFLLLPRNCCRQLDFPSTNGNQYIPYTALLVRTPTCMYVFLLYSYCTYSSYCCNMTYHADIHAVISCLPRCLSQACPGSAGPAASSIWRVRAWRLPLRTRSRGRSPCP